VNAVGLFAIGLVVTLIVGVALGLLVYGAILDGRYAAEHDGGEASQQPPRVVAGHRPAARTPTRNERSNHAAQHR
jgi:hypothetical protein